jgi:primosomal replication protein N
VAAEVFTHRHVRPEKSRVPIQRTSHSDGKMGRPEVLDALAATIMKSYDVGMPMAKCMIRLGPRLGRRRGVIRRRRRTLERATGVVCVDETSPAKTKSAIGINEDHTRRMPMCHLSHRSLSNKVMRGSHEKITLLCLLGVELTAIAEGTESTEYDRSIKVGARFLVSGVIEGGLLAQRRPCSPVDKQSILASPYDPFLKGVKSARARGGQCLEPALVSEIGAELEMAVRTR